MNFPKFWAKADSGNFTSWQWSNSSVEEARDRARQVVARIAAEFGQHGRHLERYYSERPLREPVLRELRDSAGDLSAVVTRNSYGCQVLNTARAMFVDVDLPKPSLAANVAGFLGSLFHPSESPQDPARTAIAKAQDWASRHSGWNWRIYRTPAGLRLLATHALFDPADRVTQDVFDAVDADPLYRKLCQAQQCFRARLTPKPWRCEVGNPPGHWPYPDPGTELAFARWDEDYQSAIRSRASCRLLSSGNGHVHPELQPLVTLHDDMTRANSSLPLA